MTGPGGIIGDGADPRTSPDKAAGRRKWRVVFFALAAAGVVGTAAWVPFGSRLLVVRSVVITGAHLVPRSEILAVAGVHPGMPLIRVNPAQAAARIDTIRQVRAARVTRSWPDRVVIVVRERIPALALAAPDGGYDLVDTEGVVVRQSASRPADLPLYLTTSPVASLRGDPGLAAAAAVFGELPAGLRHSVAWVTAPRPDQVTLRLAGGVTVLWGGTDRAGAKARELAVLLRAHLRYYDVSAPGSVTAR